MAEIVHDEAPARRHRLLDRDGRAAREGERDRQARAPRRKVIADDIVLLERAVLPGRRDRAGGRSREGGRRRATSPSAGNQRAARAGKAVRHRRSGGAARARISTRARASTPCRRWARSPPSGDHDRGAVGRAVGPCDDRSRRRRLRDRRWRVDLLGTADTNNLVTGIPEEYVQSRARRAAAQFGIAIRRVAGTRHAAHQVHRVRRPARSTIEHGSNSGAIGPDAASASGALAVAASRYATPATPEPFSSPGPVVRYFDAARRPARAPDMRDKPDLAASDGVDTTVPGFAPFYGTSAAAPRRRASPR